MLTTTIDVLEFVAFTACVFVLLKSRVGLKILIIIRKQFDGEIKFTPICGNQEHPLLKIMGIS
jgi:hypothetical protein